MKPVKYRVIATFKSNDPISAYDRLGDYIDNPRFMRSSVDLDLDYRGMKTRPRSLVAEWIVTSFDKNVGPKEVEAEVSRRISGILCLPADLNPSIEEVRIDFSTLSVRRFRRTSSLEDDE